MKWWRQCQGRPAAVVSTTAAVAGPTRMERQRRIVGAATDLFIEQGFGATSINQIATAADVSAQTIYATYGSKAGVLAKAIDVAVAGDFDDVPLIDRAVRLIEESGTRELRQFAVAAYFIRTLNERVAPRFASSIRPPPVYPALAELRTRLFGAVRTDLVVLVAKFWRTALRPGFSEQEAADVLAIAQSPHVIRCSPPTWAGRRTATSTGLPTDSTHRLLRPELLRT